MKRAPVSKGLCIAKDQRPAAHYAVGAAGCLPTRESYPEGGYEIQTSRFAPGAAETLVGEVLRLLREL